MKIRLPTLGLALVALCLCHYQSAVAQACTENAGTISSSGVLVNGNTCNHNVAVTGICNGADLLNGAGVDIYRMLNSQPFDIESLTVTTAAFTPELAVIGEPCSANANCLADETRTGPGSVTVQLGSNPPPGTYFVFVGGKINESPGCGAYTIIGSGFIAVKLQSFEIE